MNGLELCVLIGKDNKFQDQTIKYIHVPKNLYLSPQSQLKP